MEGRNMKPKEPHKDLKDPARQVGNLPGDTAAPDKQKLRDGNPPILTVLRSSNAMQP